MGARWYDGSLGRWISPDVIVPGMTNGSDGLAAMIGYDANARLAPLTVAFYEKQFISKVGEENRNLQEGGSSAYQSGPENPQMLNRYSYCVAGPLRWVDPEGHKTFGFGFGVNGGVGGAASGSVMIVIDDKGHIGLVISGGGGGFAGAGASVGLQIQVTDADTIQNLEGPCVQTGGSGGVGLSGGAEWVVQQGPNGAINGANLSFGVGASLAPVEFHSVVEYTKLIAWFALENIDVIQFQEFGGEEEFLRQYPDLFWIYEMYQEHDYYTED